MVRKKSFYAFIISFFYSAAIYSQVISIAGEWKFALDPDNKGLAESWFDMSLKDKIQLLPLAQLQYAADNGFIDGDTPYFNNLVQTKEELENKWVIPVKESWLKNRVKLKVEN